MAKFNKYKIQVDTYAPGLKPRTDENDMKSIKTLYSHLEDRFDGVEQELDELGIERIVIDIIKRGGLADE